MIIVKLMGGLGNQMFQYAVGRNLAHKHGTDLLLDYSFLESTQKNVTPRSYELSHFNVKCRRAIASDCKEIALRGHGWFRRCLLSFYPLQRQLNNSRYYYHEKYYHFDKKVLDLPDNVYLDGYWQSEHYFSEIETIIREDFTFCQDPIGENLVLVDKIKSCNAISLHVRRGDYVENFQNSAYHGVCGHNYYVKAVKEILHNVSNPHFFVFSDDPTWAKENLKIFPEATFVNTNDASAGFEDLRLMSICSHHIIANSTFSWWGAWLGSCVNKVVVAPSRWFNNSDINTGDLIPKKWLLL